MGNIRRKRTWEIGKVVVEVPLLLRQKFHQACGRRNKTMARVIEDYMKRYVMASGISLLEGGENEADGD